MIPSLRAKSNP
ncbi:hypothetical protein A2U01_0107507, partial [Trifolium medium]|nr:hypothetical protein [Trifolium medium]